MRQGTVDHKLEEANEHKEKASKAQATAASAGNYYPATLMAEYRTLVKKKLDRTLTREEADRFQAIQEQIVALDNQRPRPDTWDSQAQILREELAQIRAEVEALPDA